MIPTTIVFRGLEPSEALRSAALKHTERLERFAGDILTCRVAIESVERRHHQGRRFNASVHVVMDGCELDASNEPALDPRYEDPYCAIADAFDAVRRRVQDRVRRRRGDVKSHAGRPPEQGAT